ncbi:hypothetical protein CRT60_00440 [Azospirillum palustre]|uniref:Uncharacterized protein n=1 Tax=Azospirillum palustre TaxID=2044885 RepID=A0A2B8BNK3_9PROT|nr:hypothetical protein [Azospirillum palustre]PGH59435.1 hypothetical protein CRT60_00440 [Azospirillum palustre]
MLLITYVGGIRDINRQLRDLLPDIPAAMLTDAMASGLGWSSQAAMLSDLKAQHTLRAVDDAAFAHRLLDLTGRMVPSHTLLQAAVIAAPDHLCGESHPEGILAALALESSWRRGVVDPDGVEALSLDIEHVSGNDFVVDVCFGVDRDMTVWSDAVTGRRVLAGDLAAMWDVATRYDRCLIKHYQAPTPKMGDEPLIRSRHGYDGRVVSVWPDVAVVQGLRADGRFVQHERRIDEPTSRALVDAMAEYDGYDPRRTAVALQILDHGAAHRPEIGSTPMMF